MVTRDASIYKIKTLVKSGKASLGRIAEESDLQHIHEANINI
jgi:hypothetical protein